MILHGACVVSMFAATIFALEEMASTAKRGDVTRCSRCGSDVVMSSGAGRTAAFEGFVVAVPVAMELARCHGCGAVYPTSEQAAELRDVAERDLIGDGGRGCRPVMRGT